RSSARVNGSLARCSTIAWAFDGPMPGRLASSAAEAVLTLTLLPPISDPEGAAMAPVPRSTSPQRNPTAALLNRLMPTSSSPLGRVGGPLGGEGSQGASQGPRPWFSPLSCFAEGAPKSRAATIRNARRCNLPFRERLCYSPSLTSAGIARGVAQPG